MSFFFWFALKLHICNDLATFADIKFACYLYLDITKTHTHLVIPHNPEPNLYSMDSIHPDTFLGIYSKFEPSHWKAVWERPDKQLSLDQY